MNDRVFEALFRQAVIDDFNEEIDSMSSKEDLSQTYSLSPGFEIRMKKLLATDRRKDFLKKSINLARKIASILIIGLGLLYGILLFNTEVRAATENVLVGWYKQFTSYTIKEDELIGRDRDWVLNYLPQGYALENHWVDGWTSYMEFTNIDGGKIRFSYTPGKASTDLLVDDEEYEVYEAKILDEDGFYVKAIDENFENGLIWNMEDFNFDLWGKISRDELVKIAESIWQDK